MPHVRLILFASLATLTLALPVREAAAFTKVCPLTQTLDSVTVTEIGFGTVLQRGAGDVNYIEGNVAFIDIKHSLCSSVSQVKLGNTVLGTTGGIENTSQWYDLVSTAGTADGKLLTRLRLHLTNLGYGDEKLLEVQTKVGTNTLTRTIAISPVLSVNTDTARSVIGFSESDVNNSVVEGLFARYVNPAGRELDVDDDGSNDVKLYAIEFGDLGTVVDSDGIHFDLQTKATTIAPSPVPCDPTIVISADFKITLPQPNHLDMEWNNGVGPTATVSFPVGCTIAADVLLLLINPIVAAGGLAVYPFFIDYLEGVIEETARSDIQESILGAFGQGVVGPDGDLVIPTFGPEYLDAGEMRAFPLVTESVTVKVPYDDSRRTSTSFGVPIATGDRATIMTAGTAEICAVDNATWPACTHVLTGPNGLYHAPYYAPNLNNWFGDHLELYNGVRKAQRWNGTLPWVPASSDPDITHHNVGRMLGRFVNGNLTSDVLLGAGCSLAAPVVRGKLRFGVNDTQPNGIPRGAGTYLATLAFVPADKTPAACPLKTSAPPPTQ
jgi:hypothetical protein